MDRETADRIIDRYNDIRVELHPKKRRQSGPRYARQKDRDAAFAYAKWCDDQDVHPFHFMRFRMMDQAQKSRGAIPSLNVLASDSLAAFYRANKLEDSIAVWEDTAKPVYDLVGRGNAPLYTLVHELMIPPLPSDEAFRRRHLAVGHAELCRRERRFAGYGFDARSKSCAGCPSRSGCSGDLNASVGFDVNALRLGRTDSLPTLVRRVAEA